MRPLSDSLAGVVDFRPVDSVRAILVGLAIGLSLSVPSLIYFRRELVAGWKDVLGLNPDGTEPRRYPHPSVAHLRRSRWLVVLQTIVLIASALVAIGADDAVAAAPSIAVCLVTSLSLGLQIVASGVAKAELS
jgi:hypothetical protein